MQDLPQLLKDHLWVAMASRCSGVGGGVSAVLQEVCVCIHCRRASQRALLRIRRRLQIFTPEAAGMAGCTITQDDMALLPIYRRNGMPTAVFEGFDSQTRPSSNPALATRPPCFSSEQRSAILQSCLRSLPMGGPASLANLPLPYGRPYGSQ
jgi:hypothetical protein